MRKYHVQQVQKICSTRILIRINKIDNKQPREVKYYTRTTELWQLQLRNINIKWTSFFLFQWTKTTYVFINELNDKTLQSNLTNLQGKFNLTSTILLSLLLPRFSWQFTLVQFLSFFATDEPWVQRILSDFFVPLLRTRIKSEIFRHTPNAYCSSIESNRPGIDRDRPGVNMLSTF